MMNDNCYNLNFVTFYIITIQALQSNSKFSTHLKLNHLTNKIESISGNKLSNVHRPDETVKVDTVNNAQNNSEIIKSDQINSDSIKNDPIMKILTVRKKYFGSTWKIEPINKETNLNTYKENRHNKNELEICQSVPEEKVYTEKCSIDIANDFITDNQNNQYSQKYSSDNYESMLLKFKSLLEQDLFSQDLEISTSNDHKINKIKEFIGSLSFFSYTTEQLNDLNLDKNLIEIFETDKLQRRLYFEQFMFHKQEFVKLV